MKKSVIIVWMVIILVLVGGLTFIGLYKSKTEGPYRDLERNLKAAAESYFGMYINSAPNAGSVVIRSETLIEENFLDNLTYNSEECIGYVEVTKKATLDYKAYVSCTNFTTRNYDEEKLDEAL